MLCYGVTMCLWSYVVLWRYAVFMELCCVMAPKTGWRPCSPSPIMGQVWYMILTCMIYVSKRKCFDILDVILVSCTPYVSMILFIVFHALYTQYISRTDPLSSGGCVSCPHVQILALVILQLRTSTQLSWSAPLFRSLDFWYRSFFMYIYVYPGVRRGPVPSYFTIDTLRGL